MMKTFRFWCQKVLPLVYDNSLSYYEVLCKVVDYINELINSDKDIVNNVSNLRKDVDTIPSILDSGSKEEIKDTVVNQFRETVCKVKTVLLNTTIIATKQSIIIKAIKRLLFIFHKFLIVCYNTKTNSFKIKFKLKKLFP